MKKIVFLFLFVAIHVFCQTFSPDHRNLRSFKDKPLLWKLHALTQDTTNSVFYFPQRDSFWLKNTDSLAKSSAFSHKSNKSLMLVDLIGGIDFKGQEQLADTVFPGVDGGLWLRGHVDSLEFELDARIYSERHTASWPSSFDGEYLDIQDEQNNDGLKYVSYARYRGHLAYNVGFARIDLGRDNMHWGPAYYNNLSLSRYSLPYNYASVEIVVGPLSVLSIYGDLNISGENVTEKNKKNRSLYGHRYELSLGNLNVGISELQVVYDDNDAWLFLPIVPLFMEKGNYVESSSNGSLSFDLNYRLLHKARLYSEFFLDDMQSPLTLIKNEKIQAKWAWLVGCHYVQNFWISDKLIETGALLEYARVEPYVYSHFKPYTAQFENMGVPLGNKNGPNSQIIDLLLYSRLLKKYSLAVHQSFKWKGSDYGSAVNDTTPFRHERINKRFLHGSDVKYSITPSLRYEGNVVYFDFEMTLFNDEQFLVRSGFKW